MLATILSILLACVAPSLFWLGYWYYRASLVPLDRERSLRPAFAFFGAGILAGPLALAGFHVLELSPFYEALESIDEVSELEKFAYALCGIGFVEELAKFIVAWVAMRLLGGRAHPLVGGPLYAAASALGFATIENWYYMIEFDEVVWHRALTLPFNHVLFSSFWGVGLSLYHLRARRGGLWLAASLALSMIYHGLYDYVVLSDDIPGVLVLPLVFALWLWVVAAIPRLREGIEAGRLDP